MIGVQSSMRQRVLALLGIVAAFSLVALGLVIYNADRQLFDKVIPEHRALHEVEQQTTVRAGFDRSSGYSSHAGIVT